MNEMKLIDKLKENYLNVYLLAIVPILGCSSNLRDALAIGLIIGFVLFFSSLLALVLRNFIDKKYRRVTYIIIAAFMTTAADFLVQMLNLEIYENIKMYIPLVAFSAIIVDTLEKTPQSTFVQVIDTSLLNSLFILLVLCFVSSIREVLGLGELLGYKVVSYGIPKVLILQTTAGAFFVLSFISFMFNWSKGDK